jgi:hypothetical protein
MLPTGEKSMGSSKSDQRKIFREFNAENVNEDYSQFNAGCDPIEKDLLVNYRNANKL